jgi:hypothetical protein
VVEPAFGQAQRHCQGSVKTRDPRWSPSTEWTVREDLALNESQRVSGARTSADNRSMVLYLIGIPTALVVGLVVNLLTPVVQNALAGPSSTRRSKRITKIHEDTEFIERLRKDSPATVAYISRKMIRIVFVSVGAVTLNGAALVLLQQTLTGETVFISVAGLVMLVIATFRVRRAQDFCRRIYSPEWDASRTAAQLRMLGGEPPPERTG